MPGLGDSIARSSKSIHLPGLNGVRFWAAFLVLLDHLELFKPYFGITPFWSEAHSAHLGRTGVTVFFVLSGFLITYLLLQETDLGGISIRNFYVRRILRIWPLYYLIVALCFFVVPYIGILHVEGYAEPVHNDLAAKLFLFVAMMANVAFVVLPTVPFGNVLWSVAVEEQFYLFWPHLMKRAGNVLRAMLVVLGVYMLAKLVLVVLLGRLDGHWMGILLHLLDRTRFSSMIIGAIGAYAVHAAWEPLLSFFFRPLVQLLAWAAMLLGTIVPGRRAIFGVIGNELTSAVVIVLLLNLAFNARSIIRLENPVLDRLGRISYGLYVYHLFAVVLCTRAFVPLYAAYPNEASLLGALLLIATTVLAAGIAQLSYQYFELPFLRKKKAYSAIISGDLVTNEQEQTNQPSDAI